MRQDDLIKDARDQPEGEKPATRTFTQAANAVLKYLREQSDLGLWSVSRVEGEDWILLRVDDEVYDVGDNTVLKWRDSFCSRMVRGKGPMFDHDCKESSAYADAPIGRQLQIGAYVGIPLKLPDGEIFGTLCSIDPEPRAPFSEAFKASIKLASELLSLILSQDVRELKASLRLTEAIAESHQDQLTGVANRRGWEHHMHEVEQRLRPLGEPACAVVIDLDELKPINDTKGHGAGGELLRAAAHALKAACETRTSLPASAATSSRYWPLHATSSRARTSLHVFETLSVSDASPHQRAWRCVGKIGR